MDSLGAHIIRLLNENPQVYLPGLGTFKKERIPASFDEKTNTFLAPAQHISFTTESGLLAPLIKSISKAEGITDEESESQLNKVIDSILLELNEKGQYTIQNFGKLIKQGEEVSFSEDEEKEEIPLYKDVNELKLLEPVKKEPISEPNQKEEVEIEESSLPLQEFEPKGKPINWLWPIIIIAIIAIVGVFWFLNSQKWRSTEIPVSESNINAVIPDTITSLIPDTQVVAGQDTSSTTLPLQNTEPAEEEIPVQPETTYEIIIVSFGKRADAEKYVENMNAKGYKIRILENKNPGNLYKVSYGSFIDENDAQLELNKVRETLSKQAWIYKNKN